ncbi:hypothetical protein NDU88_000640 [Pleurodeles waltl]|uniref:Uncharacterized protein n=1 Tax=Pleurodeles waltl TaxID=8319 RepID=A0AAV7SXL9_PLEWA|nr:hypothetical protein NDU88_000640 [Pleurodeles waltl]
MHSNPSNIGATIILDNAENYLGMHMAHYVKPSETPPPLHSICSRTSRDPAAAALSDTVTEELRDSHDAELGKAPGPRLAMGPQRSEGRVFGSRHAHTPWSPLHESLERGSRNDQRQMASNMEREIVLTNIQVRVRDPVLPHCLTPEAPLCLQVWDECL